MCEALEKIFAKQLQEEIKQITAEKDALLAEKDAYIKKLEAMLAMQTNASAQS